jgi:hypothetical protein
MQPERPELWQFIAAASTYHHIITQKSPRAGLLALLQAMTEPVAEQFQDLQYLEYIPERSGRQEEPKVQTSAVKAFGKLMSYSYLAASG